MFESPVLQKWKAESGHNYIRDALKYRFDSIPRDVAMRLRAVIDEKKLRQLHLVAMTCPNMEAFRAALLS
jgi:hypothetical protein